MKKMFENPQVDVEKFSVEDVVTASAPQIDTPEIDTGDGGTTPVNPFG